ncbi:aromatase/cyclase [Nonomuraea typhae]|uniref:Aromatase/cyclase n=1 Tax=Nonomuraea typhae TaxID=2603600 RepID=A0ABW7YQC6_9ACTN
MTTTHTAEHVIAIEAEPGEVYRLIADVTGWHLLFEPTIHVEHLGRTGREERFRIWATANDGVLSWTSRRELDEEAGRIRFWQEVSQHPVESMWGEWCFEPVGGGTRVRLLHHYRVVGDDPEDGKWVEQAVDRNSIKELNALREAAEQGAERSRLGLTFEDTLRIQAPADQVYDFLYRAQDWPQLLPHVATVSLREETPGLQVLEMETLSPDGHRHATKSIRVCSPGESIVYKQIRVPALLTLHTGRWTVREEGAGTVAVTSQHSVMVDPAAISRVLGESAGVAEALAYARRALSTNSLTTLRHAKETLERR